MNAAPHSDPRSARRQRATLSLLLSIALLPFAPLAMTGFSGCSASDASQTVATATAVPRPSAAVTGTIRTRAAVVVKTEVQAHPKIAPWVNGLAQACFEVSGFELPSPAVLKALFGAASMFAPAEITAPISVVLNLYTQDYQAAAAVQGGSKAYLTALGQGIQDGVRQAAVSEAP